FTTSLEEDAIQKSVETAYEVAKHMPEDPFVGLHSFENSVYPNVETFDQRGIDVPLAEKIQLAKKLESLCKQSDPRITAVRQASVSEAVYEVQMMDSNGELIQHKTTGYSASITCKAEENGDHQMGGEYSFSNDLDSLPIEMVGKLAAQWATELL